MDDLSKTVGLSYSDISLNGKIGLKINRKLGKRTLAAFVVSRYRQIQKIDAHILLNPETGGQSFAHEWFHAVDFFLSDAAKQPIYFSFLEELRTFRAELQKMFKKNRRKLRRGYAAYAGQNKEMIARAFEAYISDKNPNAQCVQDRFTYSAESNFGWLYPQGDTRKAFAKAFDKLLDEIRKENLLQKALAAFR